MASPDEIASSIPSTASTPSPGAHAAGAGARPAVAVICNSHTPYRLHLHRRIAAEIPQVRLWSVFTHEESNAPWAFRLPPEIGPVSFGQGESSAGQAKAGRALHEWRKGDRIIRWMKQQDVRA